MGPVDMLPASPIFLGAAVIIVLGLLGWRKYYQFCPHCGAIIRGYRGGPQPSASAMLIPHPGVASSS